MGEVVKSTSCITCDAADAQYTTIKIEPELDEPPAFAGFLCAACRSSLAEQIRMEEGITVENIQR